MDTIKNNPVAVGSAAALTLIGTYLLTRTEEKQDASGGRVTTRYLERIGASLATKFGAGKKTHTMPTHVVVTEEKGAGGMKMDKRMYFQCIVYDVSTASECAKIQQNLHNSLKSKSIPHVIYDDTQNASAFGLLIWNTDPSMFATQIRPVLQERQFDLAKQRPGWTMFGKTYTNGHEKDMEHFLLKKPVLAALEEKNVFGIWYPMRRKGEFWMLEPDLKCQYVLHHASIGRAYGAAGMATDVRLNCFGMDEADNEFVIGLIGQDLNILSKIIQDMRMTKHTSLYMDKLGPFFVGHKKFQFDIVKSSQE